MTTTRMRAACAGLILTATLAFVALMPTAIEYGLIAGLSFNGLD
jgi:hypothetical protein